MLFVKTHVFFSCNYRWEERHVLLALGKYLWFFIAFIWVYVQVHMCSDCREVTESGFLLLPREPERWHSALSILCLEPLPVECVAGLHISLCQWINKKRKHRQTKPTLYFKNGKLLKLKWKQFLLPQSDFVSLTC